MKFVQVTFQDDSSLNSRGETYDFNEGETIGFPKPKAEALAFGNLPVELGDEYEVPDDEVSERFAEDLGKNEEDEPDAEEGFTLEEWLDQATVGDVEERTEEIVIAGINGESTREDDLKYLSALRSAEVDNQDRKGVKNAIDEAQDEIEKELEDQE